MAKKKKKRISETKKYVEKQTIAPSGLKIDRKGGTFTISWKIGDADYAGGQWINIWNNGAKVVDVKVLGAKVTSYTYRPALASTKSIRVAIAGMRKSSTKVKTSGRKRVVTDYFYSPSKEASVTWTAAKPSTPKLTYSKTSNNSGTFTWATATSDTDNKILTRVEFRTWTTSDNSTTVPKNAAISNKSANGSQSYTETLSGKNIVRHVQVRAVGPGGTTDWVTSRRAYGNPGTPTIKTVSAVAKSTSTMQIGAEWSDLNSTLLNPVDSVTVQYVIATPTNTSLGAPADGWTDAMTVTPDPNKKNDRVIAVVSAAIGDDECAWVRVMTKHDDYEKYSAAKRATTGKLQKPDFNANPNFSTGSTVFTITENTSCDVACTAIVFKPTGKKTKARVVAVLPRGTTTKTVTVTDIKGKSSACFGAYAFVGSYTGTTVNALMTSDTTYDNDTAAVAPAWVSLSNGAQDGSVKLGWPWSWSAATSAEIAWADHSDAWASTDAPKTYEINGKVTSWTVANLDTGKRWYFRVRLKGMIDTDEVTGPWSNIYSFDLSGVPTKPALILNKSIINRGESVVARWAYESEDATKQKYADICLATIASNGNVTHGAVIAHTSRSKSVTIKRTWTLNTTYYLCLRVTSSANRQSEWSEPVALFVAPAISINVTHNLVAGTGDDKGRTFMRNLPLNVKITGAGTTGTTIAAIIRASDYHIYRPDDSEDDGFEGETIASVTQTGEAQVSITTDDLVGRLDDGADYILRCVVIDKYGQTATREFTFTVGWSHQAGKPSAEVEIDEIQRIAIITPIAPDNYEEGDVCDIYRLSIDKPELIIKGGSFGTKYVDPYPAFGDFCGHRIVTRTACGDYITEDNELAWINCDSDQNDVIFEDSMVIDVNGDQIDLPYNIELQNVWTKDFERTVYLGGSIQGDWNPGVTRDITANTVILRGRDLDEQISMRGLANYAGPAHIRTPDGSSVACDIQVRETQTYQNKRVSYSLTIKVVDPQAPDGMTYAAWTRQNPPATT